MSDIASKNLYELLGNDPDEDSDREQPLPVRPVDKPVQRTGKRNVEPEAPVRAAAEPTRGGRGGRGGRGRRDNISGNEGAFRDRDAGRSINREKPTEDGVVREDRRGDRPPRGAGYEGRGEGRGRGGRGGRGGARGGDRHSRGLTTDPNDHAKQAAHGWGGETGASELQDEQAGQAIAQNEQKEGSGTAAEEPVNADGEHPATNTETAAPVEEAQAEAEPEDKNKSYATYLAELAEKKLGLGGLLTARKANEGATKQMPEGKEVPREEGADYFAGSGGKARRERERKDKNVYVLEHDIQARERDAFSGGRGGRGGARGRGSRGEGGFRGEGRGEGRGRGGRGRGEGRGEFRGRGGRGSAPSSSTTPAINDADFPSLGA